MSIVAHFVGGPWDGQKRVLPDARPTWWLPAACQRNWSTVMASDVPLAPEPPIVYERLAEDDPDFPRQTPEGDRIYWYAAYDEGYQRARVRAQRIVIDPAPAF